MEKKWGPAVGGRGNHDHPGRIIFPLAFAPFWGLQGALSFRFRAPPLLFFSSFGVFWPKKSRAVL